MICLPLLFVNNTTQTLQCVCSWIPAQKNRVLLIWPWMTLKILLNPWLAHTLGSISPNKSTEFWSFLSDPLTQLLKEKKKKSSHFTTNISVHCTILFMFQPLFSHYASDPLWVISSGWFRDIVLQCNLPEIKLGFVKFYLHVFTVLHNELHKHRLPPVIPNCCCRLPDKQRV